MHLYIQYYKFHESPLSLSLEALQQAPFTKGSLKAMHPYTVATGMQPTCYWESEPWVKSTPESHTLFMQGRWCLCHIPSQYTYLEHYFFRILILNTTYLTNLKLLLASLRLVNKPSSANWDGWELNIYSRYLMKVFQMLTNLPWSVYF